MYKYAGLPNESAQRETRNYPKAISCFAIPVSQALPQLPSQSLMHNAPFLAARSSGLQGTAPPRGAPAAPQRAASVLL